MSRHAAAAALCVAFAALSLAGAVLTLPAYSSGNWAPACACLAACGLWFEAAYAALATRSPR